MGLPLFSPSSAFWRVNRELASGLAGPRDLFVSPLSDDEREEYYRDSLLVARLFAIPERMTPSTYAEFRLYMSRMLEGNVITAADTAREIAGALFSPSVEGTLLFLGSAIGNGLLPRRLRPEFGFAWNERREFWLYRTAAASRRVRGHVPSILCISPMATLSHLRALVTL